MMHPKVSVIMPVYNAVKYVSAAIESVLKQDWPNIELVLINDGSGDASLAMLKTYEHHSFVKIIDQPNKGQCAATNVGLAAITGQYIQYLDADDILHEKSISSKMKCQLQVGQNAITFGRWGSFFSDIKLTEIKNQKIYASLPSEEWLKLLFNSCSMLSNSCYLIPKQIVEKAGGYDESLSVNNDFEYFTRTVAHAEYMYYCNDSITYYRRGLENSLSKQITEADHRKGLAARKKAIDWLLQKYKSEQMANAAVNAIYDIIYYAYPRYPNVVNEAFDYINSFASKNVPTVGGRKFTFLAKLVGFRNALYLKELLNKTHE